MTTTGKYPDALGVSHHLYACFLEILILEGKSKHPKICGGGKDPDVTFYEWNTLRGQSQWTPLTLWTVPLLDPGM